MDDLSIEVVSSELQVLIPKGVISMWEKYRQIDPDAHEAFGVLIGSKCIDFAYYHISEITEPREQDIHSRRGFTLKDPGHQAIVNALFESSGGQLVYLGTWHTHPEPNPHASSVDIKDWKACLKRNKDRLLFFIIVGTEKKALYYFDGEIFNRYEF
ncbi:Mov34/MPN/PAD-1 family protein [Photorhabdus australis]|uniref:Mov34/MPN/PAD-1 family protein n=1 Tax=Photorhabdus australis TaxID=286156 RepID=UPI00055DC815|nr:Mov34/MPN/PAD-1 family protein [Photorhabdus australis]